MIFEEILKNCNCQRIKNLRTLVFSSNINYYVFLGGMQDYNYVWGGTMEVTFEISCCKFPQRTDLPRYWQENRKGLLHFIGEVHRGKTN